LVTELIEDVVDLIQESDELLGAVALDYLVEFSYIKEYESDLAFILEEVLDSLFDFVSYHRWN
jgi:hypothetical protein